MENNLVLHLILNIVLLILGAVLFVEVRPLRHILRHQDRSIRTQLLLGTIFGLLSICCTYTGLSFQGAVVNTRVIATLSAGLVGGPITGVFAGALSGLHRYFYNPAGFTSVACSIGTFCFGLIGAAAHGWFARRSHRYAALVGLTVLAELLQCAIILLVSKPFDAALALERAILLPKIAINSAGIVAFMSLLNNLNRGLTNELAEQQAMALLIAQRCLPYLRSGMGDRRGLQQAADIVRETLPDVQVIIADHSAVLAKSGIEPDNAAPPDSVIRAIETDALHTAPYAPRPSVPMHTAIAAPLHCGNDVVGALMLIVPIGSSQVLEADIRTTESLSKFFSAMLELGELEHQINLRQQAELRALQSQINPHFLFNALNTISALCLTNPDRARETILVLADYFRQTLSINESFVTLEQELANVNNYLFLSEARFEGAIHVTMDLPDDRTLLRLPPLILQPIVENAVRHGFVAVDNRRAHLEIRQDAQRAYIRVSDQGKGFPPDVLQRLRDPADASYSGLFNVYKRLRSIYGDSCDFDIQSSDKGSTVSFSIPLVPPEGQMIHTER